MNNQPTKRSDVFLVTKLMRVTDHKETGNLAKTARVAAGLALREVARRMGVSATFVCDLEKGRRNWNEKVLESYRDAITE